MQQTDRPQGTFTFFEKLWERRSVPEGQLTIRLKNGRWAYIRPLVESDLDYIKGIYNGMGERSRQQRFKIPIGLIFPDPEEWETEASGRRQSFIAIDPETDEGLGIAHLIRINHRSAKLAISIRDQDQRIGLGGHLLYSLMKWARSQGIEEIVVHMDPQNGGMRRLVQKLGRRTESERRGDLERIEISLNRPRVGLIRARTPWILWAGSDSIPSVTVPSANSLVSASSSLH